MERPTQPGSASRSPGPCLGLSPPPTSERPRAGSPCHQARRSTGTHATHGQRSTSRDHGCPGGQLSTGPLRAPEVLNGKRELPHADKRTNSTERAECSQDLEDPHPAWPRGTPTLCKEARTPGCSWRRAVTETPEASLGPLGQRAVWSQTVMCRPKRTTPWGLTPGRTDSLGTATGWDPGWRPMTARETQNMCDTLRACEMRRCWRKGLRRKLL